MSVPDLCVREAFEKDISAIFEIEKDSFTDAYPMKLLKAFLYFPGVYIVALCQDIVIGYAIGIVEHVNQGHIISIAVERSHRRGGVGRALLKEIKERLGKMGVKSIRLEVRESNLEAIGLYRKNGYAEIGTEPDYYPDGETALVMYLSLR